MKIKELKNYFRKLFLPCRDNNYHPDILDGEFLFWYAILLIVLKAIIIPFYFYFPKNIFFAEITQTVLVELTNRARKTAGLPPLQPNLVLQQAAFMKAQDMLSKNYFSHQSPDGLSPWYWFSKIGYPYQFAGENLAVGFLDSEEVYWAWMNSPSHRNNILNPKYREIGIAVVRGKFQGGNETNIVVQLFGTPKTLVTASEKVESVQKEQEKTALTIPNTQNATTESMVLSQESTENKLLASTPTENEASSKSEFSKNIFYFLSIPYQRALNKIIYVTLIFVFSSLVATLFVDIFWYKAFSIQHKDIVLKTFVFGLLLVGLLVVDKMKLLALLPPDIYIY